MKEIKQVTKQEAAKAVIEIFKAVPFEDKNDDHLSFYTEKDGVTEVWIDKRDCVSGMIIQTLQDAFENVNIIDGQCRIKPMLLLYTVVYIESRKEVNNADKTRKQSQVP